MAANNLHSKSEGFASDIKSALHGIHGAGEALRGGSMEVLDGVFHKKEGEARNREIAERGIAEMEPGRERVHELEGGRHTGEQGFGRGHENGTGAGVRQHGVGPARGTGAGSHFAQGRAHEQGVVHREADDRSALGAARKATMEDQSRRM